MKFQNASISLLLMAAFYTLAGINHFISPQIYQPMMPPFLPAHDLLIFLSGVAEVALGLLLLPVRTRRWAAWGIIALLIAIFPANIYMYQEGPTKFASIPSWILLARLPLQLVLIAWAYSFVRGQVKTRSSPSI